MTREYLNNKHFTALLDAYRNSQENSPDWHAARNELANLFSLLADNLIKTYGFSYIDPDDGKQECVLTCLLNMHKFKSGKGKAFNYFTTIALNHLRALWQKGKRNNDLLTRLKEMEKQKRKG